MKVAINKSYGVFSLSRAAGDWLIGNKGWRYCEQNEEESLDLKLLYPPYSKNIHWLDDNTKQKFRSHSDIIECIETLKEKANGSCADIKIVDIPFDDYDEWVIYGYDGKEKILPVNQEVWE